MKTILVWWIATVLAPIASGASLDAAVETQVQAAGPLAPLHGVMLAPKSPGTAVVLILPGSGPTDHDGNNPYGVHAAPYQLLAQELARRGIATARIDKRGMFGSRGAVADANAVTIEDYAADVGSWISAIRRKTGVHCVWVLGHSEGGLVALVAGRREQHICGLLLVATPGRPLGQILREQLQADPANAPLIDNAFAVIAELEAGRRVGEDRIDPALMPLFQPAVQGFLISELALDPAVLIAGDRQPVLVLQGTRDLQVSVADAHRLHAASPSSKLALLPDTNHVLKTVTTDDRAANLAAYGNPALPLAPHVADAIADFIHSKL